MPVLRKNAQKKDGVKIELQKIPLAMVDTVWLQGTHGKPYCSMQYIADWVEGETDIAVAEGGGTGADLGDIEEEGAGEVEGADGDEGEDE